MLSRRGGRPGLWRGFDFFKKCSVKFPPQGLKGKVKCGKKIAYPEQNVPHFARDIVYINPFVSFEKYNKKRSSKPKLQLFRFTHGPD